MPAIAPASAEALLDLIRRSNLLPADRLADLPAPDELPPEPARAVEELIERGLLTKFQGQQLLVGRHKGFRIGPYVIRDQLGRGGMGAVYLAEHLDLHRRVAIKVLAPGKGEDQKLALERFLREARSSAALDHPNIVRTFDVARHAQTPFIVMEYVDGDTLQQVVDRGGPLPYAVAAECVAQAAAGLQHAHEKGVVHRDIKPANLMRDRTGVIKILDMGLARSGSTRDKLTEVLDEGAVVGTADYIAPEQAMNGTVDGRADIYSLGATFYTLVSGKTPFEGNTTQKLMQHQMRVPPPLHELNPEIPLELSAVVARMLSKKPADRFQSAAEVIAALAPWAAGSTRVLAGLSSTSLATGASGTDLTGRAATSSRRLLTYVTPSMAEIGVVSGDPQSPTGAIASAETAHDFPRPDKKGAPVGKTPRRTALIAGLSAAVVLAFVVLGWLALGGKKPDDAARNEPPPPAPPPPVSPKPGPKGDPKGDPPRVPGAEVPVFKFDPATVPEARARVQNGIVTEGKRPALPPGVMAYGLKDADIELTVGPVDGTPALAIRRRGPGGDAHVAFELERETNNQGVGLKLQPGTEYRVKFAYRTDGPAQPTVSAHSLNYKSVGSQTFPQTGGKWATAELAFTRGPNPLRLTIAALGPPDAQLALGTVELVEVRGERTRARLNNGELRPFRTHSGLTVDAADPNKKNYKLIAHTGPGALPDGWQARCWDAKGEMEAFGEVLDGLPVLGARNVRGTSAMLFSPRFDCPSGLCRLAIEYAGNLRPNGLTVRFKPDDQRRAWDVARPPVGGPKWRAFDLLVDLKGASGGFFEFHNGDPVESLRVRALTVLEPNAESADRVAFRLDATDLPAFRATKTGQQKTAGEDPPALTGVSFGGWKAETQSEWVNGPVGSVKALALTNLNDVISAQIAVDLERAAGPFEPGQLLRAKVVYRTAPGGRGRAYFQTAGEYKVVGSADLPGTTDWRTVEVVAARGAHPLRLLVDTSVHGAGKALVVRSVTVAAVGGPRPEFAGGDLGAPAPAPVVPPKAAPALDPSKWSEGPIAFAFDASTVPAFRNTKEHNKRASGDAERFPAGTGCQCWKEGATGEFRRDTFDGAAALGATNLSDLQSAQWYFNLEEGAGVALAPGKSYRVKVTYRTTNEAHGAISVQSTPGFKGVASAPLAASPNQWRVGTADFVRPSAADNVKIRFTIDNRSVGEGNTLWVRSVEVVELLAKN